MKKSQETLDQKIKRVDKWAIEIVVNILVSILTTTFILYCAGVI